jgi:hypothetical protein
VEAVGGRLGEECDRGVSAGAVIGDGDILRVAAEPACASGGTTLTPEQGHLARMRHLQESGRLCRRVYVDPVEGNALFEQHDCSALHIRAQRVADEAECRGRHGRIHGICGAGGAVAWNHTETALAHAVRHGPA